jgi:hypothetical protein
MTEEQQGKLNGLPYVIAGLSFIPMIGVLFGIIAIIWGLVTKRQGGRKLANIGAGGIAFTVVIYSGLFYFGFKRRGGVFDDLRVTLAESNLTQLVQAIEFYKAQQGKYPDSLKVLKESLPANSMVFVNDPTDVKLKNEARNFYYELVDDTHYYLLGVGPDGKPFTSDDILPKVQVSPNGKVGLLIKTTR